MKFYLVTSLIIVLASCQSKSISSAVTVGTDLIIKDTILEIDSLNFTDTHGSSSLTEEVANQALDEYYTRKGIHNYETGYQDEEFMQLCAYYDTLYTYYLNNDDYQDGILNTTLCRVQQVVIVINPLMPLLL